MFIVGKVLVSEDLISECFICDLNACKGACCVLGDGGAPLEQDEKSLLDMEFNQIKPFLQEDGIAVIEREGTGIMDEDGDLVTPLVDQKQCAYAIIKKDGSATCGIERAWLEGKTTLRKPVSCHIYPIRIAKLKDYEALNYHRWDICHAACNLGNKNKMPVYRFLKDSLVRKYGATWYEELEMIAFEWQKNIHPNS